MASSHDRDETGDGSAPELLRPPALTGYRMLGLLGRGGMGRVYLAEDECLGRKVAAKVMAERFAHHKSARLRFLREARAMATLTHPHVVRVYAFGSMGEHDYLIMELIEGESLAEILRSSGRFGPERALRVVHQVVEALEAVWEREIVHRDIKPSNILLDVQDCVKVTDFGLARLASETRGPGLSSEGTVIGTPHYLSPEQANREEVDHRSDLYSLGIVLFELLAGRRPYGGSSPLEIIYGHVHEPLPPLTHVPRSVENLVQWMTEKDPSQRPATHAELLERIGSLLKELKSEVASSLRSQEDGLETASEAPTAGPSSRPAVHHSLPAEADAFVGREAELNELRRRLLEGERLLTVMGPAGGGKTRLVRRYGWNRLGDWPGGVWFCDLSETRSLDGIAAVVAGRLGIQLGKGDPTVQLGHAIAARGRSLLILDNFEQVAKHARDSVGRWVERADQASFVVTSRVRLGLVGEGLLELEPLPVDVEAVELFAVRAKAQKRGFELTEENRPAVRELVTLLDGLPLAIELAAARARMLSPRQIVARLEDRFTVLSPSGVSDSGQPTLRAAIDWSWDLLQPWEQSALAQCSVFEGGCTLQAAEAVLDLSAWQDAPRTMDAVQRLVDKSLLHTRQSAAHGQMDDEPRFGMYLSIHEYAAEKLRTEGAIPGGRSGPKVEAAALRRHGEYYARLGSEEAIEALDRHGGVERRQTMSLELDNLVSACRRALNCGEGRLASQTLCAASAILELRGPFRTAVVLATEVLDSTHLEPLDRLRVLRVCGQMLVRCGRMDEARAHYDKALVIGSEYGDRRAEALVMDGLGILAAQQGRVDEARRHYERALSIARELGDRGVEGHILVYLGILLWAQGRMSEARRRLEQSLTMVRELGDRRSEGVAVCYLGVLHRQQGRMGEAGQHFEQALHIHRELGDRRFEGIVLGTLGDLHLEQGRMKEAGENCEKALALCRELGNRYGQGYVLISLGRLRAQQGRVNEGRGHFEHALSIHRELGDRRGETLALSNLGETLLEQGRIDEAREQCEKALALCRELDTRLHEGQVLGSLGRVSMQQGRLEEAREHFESALAIHRELGNRSDEGIELGNLGDLHTQQGMLEQARSELEAGEALLREIGDRFELGKVLCRRGICEHQAGDTERARACLDEAQTLARVLQSSPDSELGRELERLRVLLEPAG